MMSGDSGAGTGTGSGSAREGKRATASTSRVQVVKQAGQPTVGLDPMRPIAPVPGGLPWENEPRGERGVMQGLPVVYGARPETEMPIQGGVDEVQRRVGVPPAPPAYPIQVRQGREALASLARRDRRRRVTTLVSYGVVVVTCAAAIWVVAMFALEW